MKTKILMTVALTGLLGTGLYANCDFQGQKGMNNPDKPFMQNDKPMMKKDGPREEFGVLSILKELNLTPEQKEKIFEVRKEMMKNKPTLSAAFTKDSFDEEKYLKIMKQKRENMLKSKAEMIKEVYKILTPKQKEQFKVLIDLKEDRMASMMDKRMNFDKNCNGRR